MRVGKGIREKRKEIIELYVLLDDGIKPNQMIFLLDVICSLIRFHIDFIRNYRVMLKLERFFHLSNWI